MEREQRIYSINRLILEDNPAEALNNFFIKQKSEVHYKWFVILLLSWALFLSVIFVKEAKMETFEARIDSNRTYFIFKQQHIIDSVSRYYKKLPSYEH